MLYRATASLIVLFWLTMTGLLLRNELRPGDSALREVPFGHVVKLLFLHREKSELNIYGEKLPVGHVRIEPVVDLAAGTRTINYAGYLQFTVPGSKRQRVAWDGRLEMEKSLAIRTFQLRVVMREPADLTTEIIVLPAENIAHYELRSSTGILERQDYSLDERGARDVLQQLGLDPELLQAARMQRTTPPQVKAMQSSMLFHGERIDTYEVSIEHNGQTLLSFHVNQLGQILHAKTFLGYTLTPDDPTP